MIRSPGFTLLELLVVVAIIGLTTGMAVVGFAAITVPVDPVVDGLRTARTEAVRTGKATVWRGRGAEIWFEPDGSSGGGSVQGNHRLYVVSAIRGTIAIR